MKKNEKEKIEKLDEQKIDKADLNILYGGNVTDPPLDPFGCCYMRSDTPARCDQLS